MRHVLLLAAILFWMPVTAQLFNRLPVKVNDRWGYINSAGVVKIDPVYDAAGPFESPGYARVMINSKAGLIDTTGKLLVPAECRDIQVVRKGVLAVRIDSLWKILVLDRQEQSTFLMDEVRFIGKGFILFRQEGKYGLLDSLGGVIFPAVYDTLSRRSPNLFQLVQNNRKGIGNSKGKVILPCKYDEVELQFENAWMVSEQRQWGLSDSTGKILVEPGWDEIRPMFGDMFRLRKESRTTAYDLRSGKIICQPVEGILDYFNDDYFRLIKSDKTGLVNRKGKQILPAVYDDIAVGNENCFLIRKGRHIGLAAADGRELISPSYSSIMVFEGRVALTRQDYCFGAINDRGEVLVEANQDTVIVRSDVIKIRGMGDLKILELSDGRVTGSTDYSQVRTIRVGSREWSRTTSTMGGTRKLPPVQSGGWFYSPAERKYGLKDAEGRVILLPAYDQVYVRSNGLTLTEIVHEDIAYKIGAASFRLHSRYGLVDHVNGRVIAPADYLYIVMDDFDKSSSVARCMNLEGRQGFLSRFPYNAFLSRTYIDDLGGGVFRYNIKGKLVLDKAGRTDEGLVSLRDFMRSFGAKWETTNAHTQSLLNNNETVLRCEGGTWGTYYDDKVRIPPVFQHIRYVDPATAIVKSHGKWGLVSFYGKPLTEIIYDDVQVTGAGSRRFFTVTTRNPKVGFAGKDGNLKIDPRFDEAGSCVNGFIRIREGKAWGFIDSEGRPVGEVKYMRVKDFGDGMAAVKIGRLWGYIDATGAEVIPGKYLDAGEFSDGLAPVATREGWFYIDASGTVAFAGGYSSARPFRDGVAWASKGRKWGLIDTRGQWILSPRFRTASPFDAHGLAIVSKGRRYGLVDRSGKMIAPARYDKIDSFTADGLARVMYKDKIGYLDTQGVQKVKSIYLSGNAFSEGHAVVTTKDGIGMINTAGELTLLPDLRRVYSYNDGLSSIRAKKNTSGTYGVMDLSKEVRFFPGVSMRRNFSDGKAVAGDSLGSFYIDQWGHALFGRHFEDARDFSGGYAQVKEKGKWGLINDQGLYIIPPKYGLIQPFAEDLAWCRLDAFTGLVDSNGKPVLNPVYDYVSYYGDGILRVELNNKVGYITSQGTWLWEMQR